MRGNATAVINYFLLLIDYSVRLGSRNFFDEKIKLCARIFRLCSNYVAMCLKPMHTTPSKCPKWFKTAGSFCSNYAAMCLKN